MPAPAWIHLRCFEWSCLGKFRRPYTSDSWSEPPCSHGCCYKEVWNMWGSAWISAVFERLRQHGMSSSMSTVKFDGYNCGGHALDATSATHSNQSDGRQVFGMPRPVHLRTLPHGCPCPATPPLERPKIRLGTLNYRAASLL
jgi:hypothetical protein